MSNIKGLGEFGEVFDAIARRDTKPRCPASCVVCRAIIPVFDGRQRACEREECKRVMRVRRTAAWYIANKPRHKANVMSARKRRREAA